MSKLLRICAALSASAFANEAPVVEQIMIPQGKEDVTGTVKSTATLPVIEEIEKVKAKTVEPVVLAASPATVAALTTYTLIPPPSPNVLAAFFAFALWVCIFLVGFCALFAVETPVKFVEIGLSMNKEY